MTIKLGPVTTRYQGTVRIEEADADARRAVMRAQARDARGDGTAAATITTQLEEVARGHARAGRDRPRRSAGRRRSSGAA